MTSLAGSFAGLFLVIGVAEALSLAVSAAIVAPCQGQTLLARRLIAISESTYAFSTIAAVGRALDGSWVVSQPEDSRLILLDQKGAINGTVGRKGSGPGEYMSIGQLGLHNDTLWVVDEVLQRVTTMLANGDVIRTDRLPVSPVPSFPIVMRFHMLSDGSILARAIATSGPDTGRALLVRINEGGATPATFRELSRRNESFKVPIEVYGKPGWLSGVEPLADNPIWAVSRDGSLVAVVERSVESRPPTYFVELYDHTATRMWRMAVSYRPRRVPDDYLLTRVDQYLRPSASAPKSDLSRDRLISALYRPSSLPPATGVFVASDSAVWIRREDDRDTITYDIVRGPGLPIMSIQLPNRATVVWADRESAWVQELSADDLPSLVLYRFR